MAIAYGSFTITDLLDIATYIYYSPTLKADGSGSGATIAPGQDSKYIGIYSGPTLPDGQPEPGTDAFNEINDPKNEPHIEWMEAKGQPGENGKTTVLKESSTKYYQSEEERTEEWLEENLTDSDWDEAMPDLIAGHFLYMKITETWGFEGDTESNKNYTRYQSSRSGIDGADANVYEIVTDPEEIVRYTESSDKISYKIKFYQDVIDFYPYEFKDDHKTIVSTTDFDKFKICLFLFLQESTNSSKIVALDFNYLASQYSEIFTVDENNCKWSINIKNILTNNTEEGETQYPELETSNHEIELLQRTPIGFIKYYLGENLLSSIIGVRLYDVNTVLNFENYKDNYNFPKEDESLSRKNILIRNSLPEDVAKFYLHAADITMAVNQAGLKFDSNGLTLNNGNLTIYNKKVDDSNESEQVLYFDDNTGNMVIKGTIYADNGVFNGVINATDGFFNGSINAKQGEIGGFSIRREAEYIEVNSPLEQDLSKYFEQKIETRIENGNTTEIISYIKTSDTEIDLSKTYYEEKIKENYLESSDGNIKLDGLNGLIEAEEIYLGTGAKITNWIELEGLTIDNQVYPSAFIYNPATNNGKFIEAGALKIDSKGKIETGTITIDGTTNKINIGDNIIFDGLNKTLSSNSWKITPDKSEFNNVTIKGSIEAASFEYGEVTTVGGILFIKASSAITNVDTNNNTVTIKYVHNPQDSKGLFSINDICCFSTNLSDSSLNNSTIWKITNISSSSDSTILKLEKYNDNSNENNLSEDLVGGSIYKIGSLDNNNNLSDNFGIGINSSSNDSFLPRHSLSIVELTKNENNGFKYNNKLILGDLSSINDINETGYGLYADNVILNGKLVSKNDNNLTAGINSKGQGIMPSEDERYPWHLNNVGKENYVAPGNIILWAGGKGLTSAEDAKFKVDENGNLYSSSGYFKGAIVTESTIESAELRTATITGIGKSINKEYGLTIKDITNGIIFKDEENNPSSYYFKLQSDITDINTFKIKARNLVLQEKEGTFNGNFSFNDVSILDNKICYIPNNITLDGTINSSTSNTYIEFNDKKISCFDKLLIEDIYTTINNNTVFNSDEIKYTKGKANIKMVEKGYDIYVSE